MSNNHHVWGVVSRSGLFGETSSGRWSSQVNGFSVSFSAVGWTSSTGGKVSVSDVDDTDLFLFDSPIHRTEFRGAVTV